MLNSKKIEVYIKAYNQYLKYLATQKATPNENDLGDYEAIMHLQNKRWINIVNTVFPKQLTNLLEYKN